MDLEESIRDNIVSFLGTLKIDEVTYTVKNLTSKQAAIISAAYKNKIISDKDIEEGFKPIYQQFTQEILTSQRTNFLTQVEQTAKQYVIDSNREPGSRL